MYVAQANYTGSTQVACLSALPQSVYLRRCCTRPFTETVYMSNMSDLIQDVLGKKTAGY